ncbi:E3 ubiquitin-protein ligase PRP19 Ecym_8406 [Eremothecium cymbalariae DBVPG|uniref:Pre-mRNA-processing factor 19 n=1 Tax=Eremothecium cymbalariae (strain CBS 270.75 / DBVPG 7215 / KCTC 17166 / NRRL Y-17582) TaxID=931890 RepID=G8JXV2_ERECY|nr:Hypothetical protein Ecym_8406 [Eremothecium cymbalariae DBVPG\
MFCAISGKQPKIPVISPVSRCVFEKSLIEQYVEENGVDPISNTALNKEQLIEISQTPQQYALSNSVNSATLNANYSIPNLLSTLQNEWDALMLENFELRNHLDICKKELSATLYKCDAAIRVAARATQERDDLRHTLTQLTEAVGSEAAEPVKYPARKAPDIIQLPELLLEELVGESQSYVMKTKNQSKLKPKPVVSLNIEKMEQQNNSFDVSKVFTNRLINPADRVTVVLSESDVRLIIDDEFVLLKNLPTQLQIAYPIGEQRVVFVGEQVLGVYNSLTSEIQSFKNTVQGHIQSVQYSSNIAPNYFITLNDKHQIYYTSLDGSNVYQLTDGSPYFDATSYSRNLQLHKDGLLLAYQTNNTSIAIFSVQTPSEHPTILEVELTDSESDSIVNFRFAPNGYWLYVQSKFEFHVYDLRKEDVTLAMDKLKFDAPILTDFETDETGKGLYLHTTECSIKSYSYVKSKHCWVSGISYPIDLLTDHEVTYCEDTQGRYLRAFVYPSEKENGMLLCSVKIRIS